MDIDVSSLAKLLAGRYGHGMSEKCETQAEVILEVVGERIKELEAHCNDLKNGINKIYLMGEDEVMSESDELCEDLSARIPRHSLAHIQREVVEKFKEWAFAGGVVCLGYRGSSVRMFEQDFDRYAEQLTKGSKE